MEVKEFWGLYTLLPGWPTASLQGLVFPVLWDQLLHPSSWEKLQVGPGAAGMSWARGRCSSSGCIYVLPWLCVPASTRSSVLSHKTCQEIPSVRGGKGKALILKPLDLKVFA